MERNSHNAEVYILPASFAQVQFWLLTKASPNGSAFHMPACVRIQGPLDSEILRESLLHLADRHEILRTTLLEKDGELVQVIHLSFSLAFSTSTLYARPGGDRDKLLSATLQQEASRPFDLVKGPLWRAHLYRLIDSDHVLIITHHHAITDGWSQNVFQEELWTTYDALRRDQKAFLPKLEVQYGDFSVWQREWIGSDDAQHALSYWKKQLAGPLPILEFLPNKEAGLSGSAEGAIATKLLPKDLISKLKVLAQSESSTLFAVLFAGFALLLYSYSGNPDVLVASPSANRRPDTEALIGPFAGPIALRLKLTDNPTLIEVLRIARSVVTDALIHAQYPFPILLDELRVRSLRGRNPLFQFHFYYQTAFLKSRQLGDLTVIPLPTLSVGTPFELQLAVIERDEGVRGQLEYDPGRLKPEAADKILSQYQSILDTLLLSPDLRVGELVNQAEVSAPDPEHKQALVNTTHCPPRTDDELVMVQIWEGVFERTSISIHDNFFDLGGYSLLAARIVSEAKKKMGLSIDLSSLITAPTIAELVAISKKEDASGVSHLVQMRGSGAKQPLFCFHGAGGHLLPYRIMVDALPPDQPVYGLRALNLEGAQEIPSVRELAVTYLRDIRRIQPHGPYQFCGMSFGGLVAYEAATILESKGEQVSLVALFDTGNPAHYRNLPFLKLMAFHTTYLLDRFRKYSRHVAHGEFRDLSRDGRKFVTRKLQALCWMILRRCGRILGIPMHKYMQENVILFGPIGRTFTPKPYRNQVLLFRADGRTAEYGSDATLGWEGVARNLQIHVVPGSHLTLMEAPNVYTLVEQLNHYLTKPTDVVDFDPLQGSPKMADCAPCSEQGVA